MVALVTPMKEDGTIDYDALDTLVEWHIAAQTNALVVAGTTGECATLEPEEHYELISSVVAKAAGRIPVIAGTGTNSTHTTIKLSEGAKRAGAQACLIVTPYYNKPTQKGLYQHYKTIAERVQHPIIIYNVPGRTACDILPETLAKLAQVKHIIGVKEATPKVERTREIVACCPENFEIYSGDDPTALAAMLIGAKGVISVTANVAPDKMSQMCKAALAGEKEKAQALNQSLVLLHERLFVESNPIPTKWALQTMGKIKGGIRLPLLPLDNRYHDEVKEALLQAGVE